MIRRDALVEPQLADAALVPTIPFAHRKAPLPKDWE
jgi:hypothetical protein